MNATRDFLILAFVVVAMCTTSNVRADFTFGTPTNLGPTVNSPAGDIMRTMTADGLEMYIASNRAGGQGDWDLWVAKRPTTGDDWGAPENLGPLVNSPDEEGGASISPDGLTLYFSSFARAGGYGLADIWMTTRMTRDKDWGEPVNLGPAVNCSASDAAPCLAADGLKLYFCSTRGGTYTNKRSFDLWVTTRVTRSDPWGQPVSLGLKYSPQIPNMDPSVSSDDRLLVFSDWGAGIYRPGGFGAADIWFVMRRGVEADWGVPVNLGPQVNGPQEDCPAHVSTDGQTLYFSSERLGGLGGIYGDIYQAPIIPLMDFNGEGKVDAADLALLVANWGKNNTLCDIGPFAWGDGIVDERDLRVLMESLMTPGPKASDVPCDVVLSWISPSFANTRDIYLGASLASVNTASRTNPQGVLVSQGQTATTYDPPGALEFSKTYYWRVDFVISGPAPAIYQGPVVSFTTEAYARPVKNITATASSGQPSMGPEKTVDGSGLDKNDGHSTNGSDMWLAQGAAPHWIQFEFDRVYALHELWVWNSNQMVEPFIGFGARTVKIEYSPDGTTWTPWANVAEFARAPGQSGYVHDTTISFGGASAKYVKLTIEKGWGSTPSVGLSEVRFFYVPDRSAAPKL